MSEDFRNLVWTQTGEGVAFGTGSSLVWGGWWTSADKVWKAAGWGVFEARIWLPLKQQTLLLLLFYYYPDLGERVLTMLTTTNWINPLVDRRVETASWWVSPTSDVPLTISSSWPARRRPSLKTPNPGFQSRGHLTWTTKMKRLRAPVDVTSFFYVSDDDTEETPLGAAASCDLEAQPLLTLHHVHLPDVEASSGLQKREDVGNGWMS